MTENLEWAPIPGETPIDRSDLKIRSVRTRRELNIVEAKNILRATRKYLATRPIGRVARFDYAWILRLHKEMFSDVWRWAGIPRTIELNFGCAPHLIPEQLAHLLGDLQTWTGYGVSFPEQAARLHHRAVAIHPFSNGNGRWARLLANIWLRLANDTHVEWPDGSIGRTSMIREEYLAALKEADRGNCDALLSLQGRYIVQSKTE